ncbi:glycosyltransferase [Sulfitobacter sp. S223]|uniref:glycosyltransferase family 2 protein n=1 Tax=Sulfitobacter sp. S223 TaxID=2867023 RepID=UPI0021A55BD7|nr:glycosyltransferase [Sulfitobacter sp. S223]UWR25829.1 glycosyltransferase [Sulfitobacter sp. S223]
MTDKVNDTKSLVSVIIPCRDRQATIAEAVQSVLSQDYTPLEVIVIDDGSRDGTLDVLAAMSDPRLVVLDNKGSQGPSGARNYGVKQAHGDWIAFQDSDDVWLPERLSRQMDRLKQSNHIAGFCAMVIKADTAPQSPATGRVPKHTIGPLSENMLPALLRGSFISTQMLILRRDIFDELGGFDEDFPALVDWELMLRVSKRGTIDFLDEELVIQRMSDNSVTRSVEKRSLAQRLVMRKHKALFEQDPPANAQHHRRISGGLRALGDYTDARRHAVRALRAQPFAIANAVSLVRALARGWLG